MAYYT